MGKEILKGEQIIIVKTLDRQNEKHDRKQLLIWAPIGLLENDDLPRLLIMQGP